MIDKILITHQPSTGEGGGGGPKPPRIKQKPIREILAEILTTQKEMKEDINDLKSTQQQQGKRLDSIDKRLGHVEKILDDNGLKSK